ncbi:MAG TPA: hypothetical protein PKD90_07345 [Phnomibacter sp.]|nr:hypothetical protein [Phnomibacter sp.]
MLFPAALLPMLAACSQPTPVTKAEAEAFANQLVSSMQQRDASLFNTMIDAETFANIILDEMSIPFNKGFVEGIETGLKNRKMGTELLHNMGDGGSIRLLRVYEKQGQQHVLLRTIFGETDGFNYYDLTLTHNRQNEVKVADMFIYLAGQWLSTMMGELMAPALGDDKNNANLSAIKSMQGIRPLLKKGKPREALAIFEKLPAQVRNQKISQIIYLEICNQLEDEDKYLQALEEFESLYPDATNAWLAGIDLAFLRKDYPKALQLVDKLDQHVQTDPYLNYYRGLLLNAYEKPNEAAMAYEKLIAEIDWLALGYLELMIIYAEQGKKEQALQVHNKYVNAPCYNQEYLEGILEQFPNLEQILKNKAK